MSVFSFVYLLSERDDMPGILCCLFVEMEYDVSSLQHCLCELLDVCQSRGWS